MDSTWWAIARTEEVTSKKPFAADIGDKPVVLWRDLEGIARALEDRCPHRRAPLSLGCIRKEGWIQCGYHGWSYDGATGRVKEIPNLKDEQRFGPVYRAECYGVHEDGGFVRISLNAKATPPQAVAAAMPLSGTVHVALDHERYLAALLDEPGLLISLAGVHFTPYLMSELHEQDGQLVMERSCQWKRLPHWPAPFSSDYPLTLLSSTDPVTGETALLLRDRDFKELLAVRLAPVPAGRGVTAVRWRATDGAGLGLSARALAGFKPVVVHPTVDGAALRTTKPTVSVVFEDLRRTLIPTPIQSVA